MGVDERRTTAAEIFLQNLDSRIAATESAVSARPSPALFDLLARDYEERARILGRLEDLERALELSARAVTEKPGRGKYAATHARLLAGFHRFEAALETLASVDPSADTERTRGSILAALGRYEALGPPGAEGSGELADRADHAGRLVELGRSEEAHAILRALEREYRGVNPYVLAWIQTQRGIVFLREDRLEPAGEYFAAAHARLPRYYLAAEHLAEVRLAQGRAAEAAALYRAVTAQTDAPAFWAQLALAEAALGNPDAASAARERARRGFDARLARHRAAFADHAVGFLIDDGQQVEALRLAEFNLDVRQSVGAWLLLADAAVAAGDRRRACEAWRGTLATGQRPPELKEARTRFRFCGR